MRKYLYIIKTQVMSNLQYIFDNIFGFIGYFIMLLILFNVWKYLYSNPEELINGYNMNQMTWYVIITEFLWMTLGGRKLCTKISEEVKSGSITYKINKPYHYVLYCLSSHLGNILVKSIIYFILSMLTGYLFLGSFPNITPLSLLIVLVTCILANIISTFLITFIGLFSFFIEDASPFYWMYSKVILVLGTIFPIEYFPKILQGFLKYSPVYVVSYGPAKLFVDFTYSSAIRIILAQIIYLIVSYTLCSLVYKKGVKKINVNGG